jgi:hypothetical protein
MTSTAFEHDVLLAVKTASLLQGALSRVLIRFPRIEGERSQKCYDIIAKEAAVINSTLENLTTAMRLWKDRQHDEAESKSDDIRIHRCPLTRYDSECQNDEYELFGNGRGDFIVRILVDCAVPSGCRLLLTPIDEHPKTLRIQLVRNINKFIFNDEDRIIADIDHTTAKRYPNGEYWEIPHAVDDMQLRREDLTCQDGRCNNVTSVVCIGLLPGMLKRPPITNATDCARLCWDAELPLMATPLKFESSTHQVRILFRLCEQD